MDINNLIKWIKSLFDFRHYNQKQWHELTRKEKFKAYRLITKELPEAEYLDYRFELQKKALVGEVSLSGFVRQGKCKCLACLDAGWQVSPDSRTRYLIACICDASGEISKYHNEHLIKPVKIFIPENAEPYEHVEGSIKYLLSREDIYSEIIKAARIYGYRIRKANPIDESFILIDPVRGITQMNKEQFDQTPALIQTWADFITYGNDKQ